MSKLSLAVTLGCLLLATALPAGAQQEIKPVPIITGYAGFVANFEPNKQTLNPTVNPILLVPVGQRFLVETEFEMESDIEREDGVWGPRVLDKNVEYLQLDYLASRYLTVVAGRFLTPFGIFNERLHPNWIKNLQNTPFIFGLTHGSGNGAMLRGGLSLSPSVNLNYSAYFSALSTVKYLDSERSAGGRWSLFFPNQRFETGFSFNRQLGEEHFNVYGFDATWNGRRVPLDLRTEYAHSKDGSGYWIESAYRLGQLSRNTFFRRSQAVLRFEQFFVPQSTGGQMSPAMGEGMVPDVNTQRAMCGWNYMFRDGLKFSFAYGRSFSAGGDRNIWSVGIAYRFLY